MNIEEIMKVVSEQSIKDETFICRFMKEPEKVLTDILGEHPDKKIVIYRESPNEHLIYLTREEYINMPEDEKKKIAEDPKGALADFIGVYPDKEVAVYRQNDDEYFIYIPLDPENDSYMEIYSAMDPEIDWIIL